MSIYLIENDILKDCSYEDLGKYSNNYHHRDRLLIQRWIMINIHYNRIIIMMFFSGYKEYNYMFEI